MILLPMDTSLVCAEKTVKKEKHCVARPLAAQLIRLVLCVVWMFGTESLQGSEYPHHVGAGQLEPVTEQAGEQVHVRRPRWRQAVDAVTQLHQLQQGRVLGSLSVRVVYLQDQVLDGFGVKVHAVPEQLHAVHLHVADVAGRLRVLRWIAVQTCVLAPSRRVPAVTPQVEVDGLKKALPPVSQSQRPVVAVQRDVQPGALPVGISVLTDRHGPALRMAAPKGVDEQRQGGLQGAVPGEAELQGKSQEQVDPVGFDSVALEREQHPLPPRGVEPGVDAHVVAHEHAVQREARVAALHQEAQLQVLQVSVALHAQVRVGGVGHGGAAGPLGQGEARVAAGAPGPVLGRAGGAAGAVAHGAGQRPLARQVVVGAGAAAAPLAVNAHLLVFAAVQRGESTVQPEVQGPVGRDNELVE